MNLPQVYDHNKFKGSIKSIPKSEFLITEITEENLQIVSSLKVFKVSVNVVIKWL